MFANAIETVGDYTRPFIYIYRNYGDTVVLPSTETMFFVNEDGCAVTCRHVAETILASQTINAKYAKFKQAKKQISDKLAFKRLEQEYGYKKGVTVNIKCNFKGCVSPIQQITCHIHKNYDLAIVHFKGFENLHYKGHAVFADNADSVRPGEQLCRLGFPFPELGSAIYNGLTDDIEWGESGTLNTPRFPTDGMVTRHVAANGRVHAIELSTPGIKGQKGGPVFNKNAVVYGMQYETRQLNLGYHFDEKGVPLRDINAKNGTQAHFQVGHCLSAEIIKEFLRDNNVRYYTESDINR